MEHGTCHALAARVATGEEHLRFVTHVFWWSSNSAQENGLDGLLLQPDEALVYFAQSAEPQPTKSGQAHH